MANTLSLPDYYDRLMAADWFYMMSDDASVYRAGKAEMDALIIIGNFSAGHAKLFHSVSDFKNAGCARPDRPVAEVV